MVFLGSSGSEAMESGHQGRRTRRRAQGGPKIVYAEKLLATGKTKGACCRSPDGPLLYRGEFQLVDNTVRRALFADIEAVGERLPLRSRNRRHRCWRPSRVAAGIVSAPAEYWQEAARTLRPFGVLWGRHEVQCGPRAHRPFLRLRASTAWCPTSRRLPSRSGGGKAAVRRDYSRVVGLYYEGLWQPQDRHDLRPGDRSAPWARRRSPPSRR